MTSLIGKQLGDYTLVSVLATGGMARIYEGVDHKLGRQAAVKVLEMGRSDAPDADQLPIRFQREARAVAQLEHDNIITIYQYGEQDGLYFIAMRLIRGRDLAQELARLRRNGLRMDVQRALRILEQVAAALDCAHAAKIIHRDVKPSNVLLDANDRATLTDFGLVMHPNFDSTLGTAFGTPRYIAPEQAVSSIDAVPQSDIYSLGVILYEVLTGQTPFDGSSPMEIALSQINDPPPPPRTLNLAIPPAAEQAILKALEKDPTKRQASAGELIGSVKRAYDPDGGSQTALAVRTTLLPQTPTPPSPTPIFKPEPKRPPILRIALTVILILIAGGIIWIASHYGSSSEIAPPTSSGSSAGVASTAQIIAAVTQAPAPPANILLSYDDSVFTLINVGSALLDVSGLQFTRDSITFAGSSIPRGTIPGNACFRIELVRAQEALPNPCKQLTSATVRPDIQRFFWRSDVSGSFEVRYNGTLITTCATVTRGASATCSAALTSAE